MTTASTSPSERVHAPEAEPSSPTVVAAVLYVDADGLGEALDAVMQQVYEPSSVAVIGGREAAREIAEQRSVGHNRSFYDFVAGLGSEVDTVWVVHGDARPRPDALGALITEMERNEASAVGSKILDAEQSDRLESVGSATDVFGEPYSGLDPGEVDLEQYDVVRDVAFVSGVSVLIRRDLLRGLRGPDSTLPPIAAGMDLSQRARIAGGRVMVVPSSEVLHARRCGHDVAGWRELAGRMRAMLKAYRPITLIWLIPIATLVGLLDAVVRLFLDGTGPLRDFVRAAWWNLAHLPSLITARRALSRVRVAGDEELFRYQVQGSVRLRALLTDVAERLGWVIDEEPAIVEEDEIEAEMRRTGPVVAGLVLVALALASRRLWFGSLPATGFMLPVAEDLISVLVSYAGGWNPAGLGSAAPLHPAPAGLALVGLALGAWAQPALTAASMILGVAGVATLLRRLGVDGASRYLAGLVLVLGPFAAGLTQSAHWSGLVALGGFPWLVALAVDSWPGGWKRRVGRVGWMALAAALVGTFAPLGFAAVLVAAVLGFLLVDRVRLGALARAALAGGLAAAYPASYLVAIDLAGLTDAPQVEARPPLVLGALLLAVGIAGILSAPSPRWRVVAWGAAMMSVAVAVGSVPGWGGEVQVAAVLLASLGAAVSVGATLPIDTTRSRGAVATETIASLAAVAVVMATLVAVPAGRAGMPDDQWTRRLEFVESLAPPTGPGRVLVAGMLESMPGEWRTGNGYAYRLVWGDQMTLDQAWLAPPGPGDVALQQTLDVIDRGDVLRPGSLLGSFAIRWIVVLDDVSLAERLTAQVDLASIPLAPGISVFENLAARPRAEASGGEPWVAQRVGALGPAGSGTVRLADNAHPGWSPDWQPDEWANRLSATEGVVWYRQDPLREALAWAAVGMLAAALVMVLTDRALR